MELMIAPTQALRARGRGFPDTLPQSRVRHPGHFLGQCDMGFRVARRGKPLATMGSGLRPSRGQLERPEDHRAWLNRVDNLKRTMQAQSLALSLLFITTEQLYDLNIFIPAVVRNAPKFFIPGDTLFLW